jgi:hypothetical protein
VLHRALFTALMVTASGATELLSTLGGQDSRDREATLASSISMIVIGLPTFILLWRATSKFLRPDPSEGRAPSWKAHLDLTLAVSLIASVVGWVNLLNAFLGGGEWSAGLLAAPIIWSIV